MTADANRKIVQTFYAASNMGEIDTCLDLIADDIKWTNIGSTALSGTFHGKAELQEKLLGPLFGKLQQGIFTNVHRLIAEDDFVVAQTSGTAETRDGRPYNNTYCWVVRIRDGKIAEVMEYMDTELVAKVFK